MLGLTVERAEAKPNTLRAVLRALMRAGAWADQAGAREELAALITKPQYVGPTVEGAGVSLTGDPLDRGGRGDFTVFHRGAASFPWISHALWFLERMRRTGQLPPDADLDAVARRVYRPDLWREAAEDLGLNAPVSDAKVEGAHGAAWRLDGEGGSIAMAADRFFDGAPFDPAALRARRGG